MRLLFLAFLAGVLGISESAYSQPVPIGVAEVEDADDIAFLRKARLVGELLLSPTGFVQRVEPLHAYDGTGVCRLGFLQDVATHPERYGRAALITRSGDRNVLTATYYQDIRQVFRALEQEESGFPAGQPHSRLQPPPGWCEDHAENSYFATTLPVEDPMLDRHLMVAAPFRLER